MFATVGSTGKNIQKVVLYEVSFATFYKELKKEQVSLEHMV